MIVKAVAAFMLLSVVFVAVIHTLVIASHVEAKFAMMMRDGGMRDAAIAINNRPCQGNDPTRWGCDDLLPRLLPADSKLTVYGPDGFSKTYTSEEKTDDR